MNVIPNNISIIGTTLINCVFLFIHVVSDIFYEAFNSRNLSKNFEKRSFHDYV